MSSNILGSGDMKITIKKITKFKNQTFKTFVQMVILEIQIKVTRSIPSQCIKK